MTAPFPTTSQQTYHRRGMGPIALIGVALAAWALARWRPFRVEVAGSSMAPRLWPGDWAVATSSRGIVRGDVVVVKHPARPGMEMVKRLTGVPGDVVRPGRALGPDEWFVSGDNPDASTDSRTFGPLSRDALVGRVRLVYWPPEHVGPVRRMASEPHG